MSVERVDVVDFVSINSRGDVVLTISDHLSWDGGSWHLQILQEKVNAYISYIESGQLLESYPDGRGRRPVIALKAMYEPNKSGFELIAEIKRVLDGAMIGFIFEHTPLRDRGN
jgi:hypothetical protein